MNAPIEAAISQGYPLYWEAMRSAFCRLKLVAETYTYESGRTRTRTLWTTYNARAAQRVHNELLARGASVSGNTPRQIYEMWEEAQG